MHVPAPIAALLSGPGRLISAGLAFLAAIFGILAEGYVGVSVFVIVSLALVVVELWRDSAGLTSERDEARSARDQHLLVARQEREKARNMDSLEAESAKLKQRAARLVAELEAQANDPSRLLGILARHADLVAVIRRQRALSESARPARWPVLAVKLISEQLVEIRCFATQCDYVSGEPVSLIAPDTGQVHGTGEATVEGSGIVVVLRLDELPLALATDLEAESDLRPVGYAVELAGLAMSTYHDVSDDALKALEEQLSGALKALVDDFQHER